MTGETSGSDDRRVAGSRAAINLVVSGRVPATPIHARVIDISRCGCCVESADIGQVVRGATILLAPPGLAQLVGLVTWVAAPRLGVRFHRAIDPETIDRLQQRAKSPSSHADPF